MGYIQNYRSGYKFTSSFWSITGSLAPVCSIACILYMCYAYTMKGKQMHGPKLAIRHNMSINTAVTLIYLSVCAGTSIQFLWASWSIRLLLLVPLLIPSNYAN